MSSAGVSHAGNRLAPGAYSQPAGNFISPKQVKKPSSSLRADGASAGASSALPNSSYANMSPSTDAEPKDLPGTGNPSDDGDVEDEKNPFLAPDEEEVFVLRDRERQKKKELRQRFMTMSILEKTAATSGSTIKLKVTTDDVELTADDLRRKAEIESNLDPILSRRRKAEGNARSKEKENLSDYIQKKREMFLVQMSLDAKKSEIKRLEEKAVERERKLREEETILEENAQKFDEFLKDNDMKAVEAMRRAETQTKEKTERVSEIKRLNAQIQAIKSQMAADEEKLEEWRKYKDFLLALTPEEWKAEQRERIRGERYERLLDEYEQANGLVSSRSSASNATDASTTHPVMDGGGIPRLGNAGARQPAPGAHAGLPAGSSNAAAATSSPVGQGNSSSVQQLLQKRPSKSSVPAPGAPAGPAGSDGPGAGPVGAGPAGTSAAGSGSLLIGQGTRTGGKRSGKSSAAGGGAPDRPRLGDVHVDDVELPMYFTEPQQLMDIFTTLEERNLFLIQNSQETEEALEEVKHKFDEVRQKLEGDTSTLNGQIDHLKAQIEGELQKARNFHTKMNSSASSTAGGGTDAAVLLGEDKTLNMLTDKVLEVYRQAGFENDAKLSTLDMLRSIEAKLNELITEADALPPEYVEQAEKEREKKRRQYIREEKIEQQKKQQEERMRRALERSQAPVQKRMGPPVMFRSRLAKSGKNNDNSPGKASGGGSLPASMSGSGMGGFGLSGHGGSDAGGGGGGAGMANIAQIEEHHRDFFQ